LTILGDLSEVSLLFHSPEACYRVIRNITPISCRLLLRGVCLSPPPQLAPHHEASRHKERNKPRSLSIMSPVRLKRSKTSVRLRRPWLASTRSLVLCVGLSMSFPLPTSYLLSQTTR